MPRPLHNRSRAVRDYLEANSTTAFTAREVAQAVAPKDRVDLVHATLANLARGGHVLKLGSGYGNVHFAAPREPAPPRKRGKKGSAHRAGPATVAAPRKYAGEAELTQVRKHLETKPLRETITGLAVQPKRGRRAPLRSTNFTAAPGTTIEAWCPARRASARIAADIAEFEARGGVVERLGPTMFFHQDDAANDDDDQP